MRTTPVKVVHVIGALIAGGAERFVVSLVRTLKVEGVDVSLWVLSTRSDAAGLAMIEDLRTAGIPCEIGPTVKVGWKTILWYGKQRSAKRPDVVHLHTPNTELMHFLSSVLRIEYASLRHRGLFRTLHNTEQSESLLVRRAYRGNKALCSIACGKAVERRYAGRIDGQLTCIENGVDFTSPINTGELAIAAREKLGLVVNGYHVLNVGRMSGASMDESQKAQNTLLRAWRQSGLGKRNCYLHLLGDGNLRAQLADLAGEDRSILFHGVQEDIPTWLQASDCFVLPSRYEGLPIAGIEAIGAGLPCIFSDISPLRELSPPKAMWCPVNDVSAFATSLDLVFGERANPSLEEVKVFRERNSIAKTAQQYRYVYHANGYPI